MSDHPIHAITITRNGKPLYFGAVRNGRRYVSFHLMPVPRIVG